MLSTLVSTAYLTHAPAAPGLAVSVMAVSVPASFVPSPITLVFLATVLFGLDGDRTTTVLVAVVMAFSTNCGLGMTQFLIKKRLQNDMAARATSRDEQGPTSTRDSMASTFVLSFAFDTADNYGQLVHGPTGFGRDALERGDSSSTPRAAEPYKYAQSRNMSGGQSPLSDMYGENEAQVRGHSEVRLPRVISGQRAAWAMMY